jgi:hypothetical protein
MRMLTERREEKETADDADTRGYKKNEEWFEGPRRQHGLNTDDG